VIQAIAALVELIARFFKWREDNSLKDQGREAVLQEERRVVEKVRADSERTRSTVRSDLDDQPDKLRDDDGFRRSD